MSPDFSGLIFCGARDGAVGEWESVVQNAYFLVENSVSLMGKIDSENRIIFFTSAKICGILSL